MGGIFSHNLRDSTTHLMVGKAGSQKYTVSELKYDGFIYADLILYDFV